jgi:MoxR-like ATPase
MVKEIKKEIHKVIIGQEELCDALLLGLLSGGHILVEGVPGLAKTTAIKAFSQVLGLDFKRVQFTPDLLPSDITGSEVLDLKQNDFKIKHGPIFTNLLLADEINRAGPKVQSALLEAMAEKQVTIGEETFKLNKPFLVMATANPVEQDGTYELPEASLDRFMLKVIVGYNNIEEEFEIITKASYNSFEKINQLLNKEQLFTLQQEAQQVHIDKELIEYILKIIFATRNPKEYDLDEISQYIEFGASPRGSIDMFKASKTYAYIQGKDYVTPSDISKVAYMVLRHRLILNYVANANNITSDDIIFKILQKIPTP